MEPLLSLIANIIAIAQALPAIGPVRKLQRNWDEKKLRAAYYSAFTTFFDSYRPGDYSLVISYDFFDRQCVKEQVARLAIGQPMDQGILLEEFKNAVPDHDPVLFLNNIDRFRDKFNEALTQDLPLDAQLAMSHTTMTVQASTLNLGSQIEDLKRLIITNQVQSQEHSISVEASAEEIYRIRIDEARDLIKEDKADAALLILKKLESELIDREISVNLRFRLLTNLGASFLYLGNDSEAAPYFERALDYAPRDPKAIANAALAALIQGNGETAINLSKQALEIQPDHSSALSVFIQALAKGKRLDLLDQDTRVYVERNIESRRSLAAALSEAGQSEEAEKLLRLSIEESVEKNPQDLALLAQAMLIPIQISRQESPPLPWNVSPDENARLQEAEDLLTQVVEAWGLIKNRVRFHSALMLRANARALQDKFELSKQDCQRILSENPVHPMGLYHSGLLALQTQNYSEAIGFFSKCLGNPPQGESVRMSLAVAYLNNKQPRDALKVLLESQEPQDQETLSLQLERLFLTAWAALMGGETDRLTDVIQQLSTLPKDNPLVLETLASVTTFQGDTGQAIQYFDQALALADGYLKDRIVLQLAHLYFDREEFDKAVPLYELVAPTDRDTPPTRNYLVSLLNSDNWKKAHDLARQIRNERNAIPVISEVEARVADFLGDLELALKLYSELAELEPNRFNHFLGMALAKMRMGKSKEAASILGSVMDRFQNNPWALINTAQIFASAGHKAAEVLPLAYKARKLGMDNSEIHLRYVGLFMNAEGDPSVKLDLSEVEIDSSIRLESEHETRWCTILGADPIDRGKGEYPPTDPAAQKLLGCKIGEVIELKSGPFEQLSFTVAEIQSIYVRAFQETFLNFSTWFPDHEGMHRIKIVDNDVTPIFRISEIGFAFRENRHELYSDRQLTLEGFAQSIGTSLAEAWGAFTHGDYQFIASDGTYREQQYHYQVMNTTTAVTVDLLALFTLSRLNRLDTLTMMFQRIYVAQASLDVLIDDIHRLRQFNREHHILGREGERYIFEKIPLEVIAHNIRFLEQALEFTQENCQVMPTTSALEFKLEQFRQFEFVLGRSSTASMLVAKETNTTLYSDDLLLRTIARRGFSVQGIWTQPVLLRASEAGKLGLEDYYNAVAELVRANYYYVSLRVPVLMHVLSQNQWVLNPTVAKVFAPLRGPKTSTRSALRIVTDLIEKIWSVPIPNFHRTQLLDLCLQTLVANRNREIILFKLRQALRERFAFREHLLIQINRDIDLWLEVHQELGV